MLHNNPVSLSNLKIYNDPAKLDVPWFAWALHPNFLLHLLQ
jgi:hypothetical protein